MPYHVDETCYKLNFQVIIKNIIQNKSKFHVVSFNVRVIGNYPNYIVVLIVCCKVDIFITKLITHSFVILEKKSLACHMH